MPNPLSKVRPSASWNSGSAEVAKAPDLMKWVGLIVSGWVHVDMGLGRAFTTILKSEADAAFAVFDTLSANRAQDAAINALAEAALSGADLTAFKKIMTRHLALRKERNKFAHFVAALSPELPDHLLLIPPEPFLKWHRDHVAVSNGNFKRLAQFEVVSPKDILVYKREELEKASKSIDKVGADWFEFVFWGAKERLDGEEQKRKDEFYANLT